ncbi:hypothetical protein [Virgibacillus sp. YIM 98842]|uniref:hypothetical protein n=1 Tax=Virgibacillus sp. YIM 98842 TaxID=2663533 RepID=UPI0013D9D0C0|nr:hypothetical protein [Virgibacillus sp. YIM 98842]
MLQKLLSRIHMVITRFSLYSLLKSKGSELKESKTNVNISMILKQYEENLVQYHNLNDDLSKGKIPAQSKNGQRLVSAFDVNHGNKNKEDFYFRVAEDWVKDFGKKMHQFSFLLLLLFLIWYAAGLFLEQYISGFLGFLFILGIILIPLLGFLFAGMGKERKKYILIALHILFLFAGVMIIL